MERRVINPWTWRDAAHARLRGAGIRRRGGKARTRGRHAGPGRHALHNLETVLGQARLGPANVVRLSFYVLRAARPRRESEVDG